MKASLYRIDCITNMHVGNGEVNYNIIDNEVEKDPVLQTPTINPSGIKGALRQHFEKELGKNNGIVEHIFGNDRRSSVPAEGMYKFMSANLLSRPLRVSKGSTSYIAVTTNELLCHFLAMADNLGIDQIGDTRLPKKFFEPLGESDFAVSSESVQQIEGSKPVTRVSDDNQKLLTAILGCTYAVCEADTLRKFDLPVLARNVLDCGRSVNLWYEEIVPHTSAFYFFVLSPEEDEHYPLFENTICTMVQFGGNASIGYGYTRITRMV